MKFIDTHAHYYALEFKDDLLEGIQRCKENNISKGKIRYFNLIFPLEK